jgi:hypothetical protein
LGRLHLSLYYGDEDRQEFDIVYLFYASKVMCGFYSADKSQ